MLRKASLAYSVHQSIVPIGMTGAVHTATKKTAKPWTVVNRFKVVTSDMTQLTLVEEPLQPQPRCEVSSSSPEGCFQETSGSAAHCRVPCRQPFWKKQRSNEFRSVYHTSWAIKHIFSRQPSSVGSLAFTSSHGGSKTLKEVQVQALDA